MRGKRHRESCYLHIVTCSYLHNPPGCDQHKENIQVTTAKSNTQRSKTHKKHIQKKKKKNVSKPTCYGVKKPQKAVVLFLWLNITSN
jgi:inosine-uridine nucleoside N-ribohydrolase